MNRVKFIKTVFWRGLRKSCPRCGSGSMFRSLFIMNTVCPLCNLAFLREGGTMIGGMYVSAGVTQLFAILLVVFVWIFTDWPPSFSIAICVPLSILFSLWFFPYSKAIWVCVDYIIDMFSEESMPLPGAESGE